MISGFNIINNSSRNFEVSVKFSSQKKSSIPFQKDPIIFSLKIEDKGSHKKTLPIYCGRDDYS